MIFVLRIVFGIRRFGAERTTSNFESVRLFSVFIRLIFGHFLAFHAIFSENVRK